MATATYWAGGVEEAEFDLVGWESQIGNHEKKKGDRENTSSPLEMMDQGLMPEGNGPQGQAARAE